MARAVERLLGRRISGGFLNVPDGVSARLHRIQLHSCGIPSPMSVARRAPAAFSKLRTRPALAIF